MTQHAFFAQFARILNSGQSRSVVLCGNIHDLFFNGQEYVPLIPFLCQKSKSPGILQLVYELNGPIRIAEEKDRGELRNAWVAWRSGMDLDELIIRDMNRSRGEVDRLRTQFDDHLREAIGNPTLALEFLRQLTLCSRAALRSNLLIFIEAADLLIPAGTGDVTGLNDRQLRRVAIVQDWFGDPAFLHGQDSVCLVAESRHLLHPRVSRLPQVLSVEVPSPPLETRKHFIDMFCETAPARPNLWAEPDRLAEFTAGLSLHAIRQLLAGAAYAGETLEPAGVVEKVEAYVQSQLGEDVVEFKKPEHRLDDVIGFTQLKKFLREELIPRFQAKGKRSLAGAGVAGPIGSGKTFIFEAMAAELGVPVLVLKSIRSQWFGQTDVIFERLRRVLEALDKVVIFVDEADTQFGSVDATAHATERRLTGKIQAMMSDPRLRGRVVWLLMTARIHLLSPDIRRPGRVGDLILPVLDPEGDDRRAFLKWVLGAVQSTPSPEAIDRLDALTEGYSAAAFASLRSHLQAHRADDKTDLPLDRIIELLTDHLPPAIGPTRRYQELQALVNCTRRSLLPDATSPDFDFRLARAGWEKEIRALEAMGIH
ncbi:MAG: ATP-binding protein [Pirellulales bacterium]|nr:ATP-binding protein [Pirellulales bacterium]